MKRLPLRCDVCTVHIRTSVANEYSNLIALKIQSKCYKTSWLKSFVYIFNLHVMTSAPIPTETNGNDFLNSSLVAGCQDSSTSLSRALSDNNVLVIERSQIFLNLTPSPASAVSAIPVWRIRLRQVGLLVVVIVLCSAGVSIIASALGICLQMTAPCWRHIILACTSSVSRVVSEFSEHVALRLMPATVSRVLYRFLIARSPCLECRRLSSRICPRSWIALELSVLQLCDRRWQESSRIKSHGLSIWSLLFTDTGTTFRSSTPLTMQSFFLDPLLYHHGPAHLFSMLIDTLIDVLNCISTMFTERLFWTLVLHHTFSGYQTHTLSLKSELLHQILNGLYQC